MCFVKFQIVRPLAKIYKFLDAYAETYISASILVTYNLRLSLEFI